MNEYIDDNAIDNLVMLVVSGAFLLVFWILETAWRNDKRWIIPIFIFPPLLLIFIYNYWEESRAKCFFVALYLVIIVLLGSVTGYDFFYRVMLTFKKIVFWQYMLFNYTKAWLLQH